MRFLSKSHLPSKSVEEQLYACLFCVHLNKKPEESDATVFFSQNQLFAHLARHPRPLAVVPALTVIDAPEIPPAYRNDYDLHFIDPPRPNVMEGINKEIQLLPTATAVDTIKRVHGTLKRPPGGGDPLQFAAGARIMGIEFPEKYNGEWCIGWADQSRATFPADAIKLDPPPQRDIKLLTPSPMTATVRWKWNVKDKERTDWLKLEKNDVITNIACKCFRRDVVCWAVPACLPVWVSR